jgi:hypothetical protein
LNPISLSRLRRDELDPNARVELFRQIAAHFKKITLFPRKSSTGSPTSSSSEMLWMPLCKLQGSPKNRPSEKTKPPEAPEEEGEKR